MERKAAPKTGVIGLRTIHWDDETDSLKIIVRIKGFISESSGEVDLCACNKIFFSLNRNIHRINVFCLQHTCSYFVRR